MSWWGFKPYVSVAQRRAKAARHASTLAKKGHNCCPVTIDGLKIARTFWGKAWCDHLESYSDFANRLPRGRSYVRNGSVIDLQIQPGKVSAIVCGTEIYDIEIKIKPLAVPTWKNIKTQCAGKIDSLVELLQGKLSRGVMEIITLRNGGMFPSPSEIDLDCSCPDWADMCKHVAATLYGVGARLDEQPELLFTLRKVDHLELIEQAGNADLPTGSGSRKTLDAGELADVFGIELEAPAPNPKQAETETVAPKTGGKTRRKTTGQAPGKREGSTSKPVEKTTKRTRSTRRSKSAQKAQ